MSTEPATTDTTSTSTTTLTDDLMAYLDPVLADAESLYNSGVGSTYYPGDTYIPWNDNQTAAYQGIENIATGGNPFVQPAIDQYTSVVNNGGMSTQQQDALSSASAIANGDVSINTGDMYGQWAKDIYQAPTSSANYLTGIASGSSAVDTKGIQSLLNSLGTTAAEQYGTGIASGQQGVSTAPGYQSVFNANKGPTAASQYLTPTARGDYLENPNPYMMSVLDTAAGKLRTNVDESFNGMGRYGSGAHQDALSTSIGSLYADQLAQDYSNERGRQMTAAGMLDQSSNAQAATQLGALGGQTNAEATRIGQQLQSQGQIDNSKLGQNSLALSGLNSIAGIQGGNLDRQINAAGQMDSAQQAQWNTAMQALSGQTGVEATNIANMGSTSLALGDQYANATNTALDYMNSAQGLSDLRYDDAYKLLDVGNAQQDEAYTELGDEVARYDAEQNAGWDQIANYLAPLLGTGQTTTTATGTVEANKGTSETDIYSALASLLGLV